jgi:predicted transcriptional regulator
MPAKQKPEQWHALSVRQPFAHLICAGLKRYECRSWCPSEPYGDAILIHASGNLAPRDVLARPAIERALKLLRVRDVRELPRGAIVGVVNIHSVIEGDDENATRKIAKADREMLSDTGELLGGFYWRLTAPAFVPPIRCKGRLGLWPISAAITKRLPRNL